MPVYDDTGCSRRVEIGLAYRQRVGQAIHGETASEDWGTCSWSYRDRRDIVEEGAYISEVISDLERKRPIWFGGKDRSEGSLDTF